MKQCLECGKTKPLEEFHMKRGKPQARCKMCRAKYMKDLYQKNRETERAKRKEYYELNKAQILEERKTYYNGNKDEINITRRLKKYGLTRQQYEQMLTDQNHKCANLACVSGNNDLAIDHCHISLTVRGILCDNCNTALGLLKESFQAIDGLKAYLEKCKK